MKVNEMIMNPNLLIDVFNKTLTIFKKETVINTEQFQYLLNPIKDNLYNFVYKALNFSEDANDIYQELILRALELVDKNIKIIWVQKKKFKLRAHSKKTSHFHIQSSGHIRPIFILEILDIALLCLWFRSIRSNKSDLNLGANSAKLFLSEP